RFDDDTFVNLPLRRLYLDLDAGKRKQFGNPFRARGANSFLDWATRPDPAEENLSPFLLSLYQVRFDMWNTFPDVRGRDRKEFLEWARTDGARQMKFDPEQMRIQEAAAANGAGGRNGASAAVGVATDQRAEPMPDSAVEAVRTWLPPEPVRRY